MSGEIPGQLPLWEEPTDEDGGKRMKYTKQELTWLTMIVLVVATILVIVASCHRGKTSTSRPVAEHPGQYTVELTDIP